MQEVVYGKPRTSIRNLMAASILSGIAAGIIVSVPMMLMGITFSQDMGIQYVIILSLLLMLIDPRFLCFSYSGGLLALLSLIFGFKGIDATGIMVLVAILHLLESILIFLDGSRGAVPVFLQRDDGSLTGGFSMQRFWPIPVALVFFMGYSAPTGDVLATPNWWPLIRPYIDPSRIGQALFSAMPVAAILGYSEFTSSYLPQEKCRATSFKLAVFSLTLLLFSIISSYVYVFKYIAAVFAPVAHEALLRYEKRLERQRPSIFTPTQYGIKVLDTIPDGAGEKMGIMPGDTIVSINNRSIVTEEGLTDFLNTYPAFIWVDVVDRNRNKRTIEYKDYKNGISSLDILTVPKTGEGMITVKEAESPGRKLWKKISKNRH